MSWFQSLVCFSCSKFLTSFFHISAKKLQEKKMWFRVSRLCWHKTQEALAHVLYCCILSPVETWLSTASHEWKEYLGVAKEKHIPFHHSLIGVTWHTKFLVFLDINFVENLSVLLRHNTLSSMSISIVRSCEGWELRCKEYYVGRLWKSITWAIDEAS